MEGHDGRQKCSNDGAFLLLASIVLGFGFHRTMEAMMEAMKRGLGSYRRGVN
jgi:hypothetical protein